MKIKRFIKRIKRSRRKTNMLSLVLIILVFGLTLGYAYVHTTLEVDGTVNVSSANWNVYWDNIVVGSNNQADVTTAPTISTGKTEVTFSVTFNDPGDNYEFTVDAVNDGTIDAMISNVDGGVYETDGVTSKPLPEYLEYEFTYSDGVEIEENHLLASGSTETYQVSVHYKEGFDTSELPTEDEDYVFKFGMNYVQKARTAVARPQLQEIHSNGEFSLGTNKSLISVSRPYSLFDDKEDWESLPFHIKFVPGDIVSYWSEIKIDDEFNYFYDYCLHENDMCYDTKDDCLDELQAYATDISAVDNGDGSFTSDNNVYSCHLQKYYTIESSYVVFTISDKMANENVGLTAGTYSLKGGSSSYYEANKSILMNAFGSSNCVEYDDDDEYRCNTLGLIVNVYRTGNVAVRDMSKECAIVGNSVWCDGFIG